MLYRIYGLRLASNEPIPGWSPASFSGTPEVRISLRSRPHWCTDDALLRLQAGSAQPATAGYNFGKLAGGAHSYLRYGDGAQFVFNRDGSELWADWPDDLSTEDMATYLCGPVMGYLLRLRGIVCLHASAVVVGDYAVALVGVAGAGKSTTAAAFAEGGWPVLTDDIVALGDRGDYFTVPPGDPRIRLWPQSVLALYGPAHRLPPITGSWDKSYLDLRQERYRFPRGPLRLGAIYVLAERLNETAAPRIHAVAPRDGFFALLPQSFASSLLDRVLRADEFNILSRLVEQIPIRKVHPHTEARKLARLCQLIIDDSERLTGASQRPNPSLETSYV